MPETTPILLPLTSSVSPDDHTVRDVLMEAFDAARDIITDPAAEATVSTAQLDLARKALAGDGVLSREEYDALREVVALGAHCMAENEYEHDEDDSGFASRILGDGDAAADYVRLICNQPNRS